MKNEPLKFQKATADHVLDLFKNGQKRVLIGDEAGLGKTTVAAQVIERVKTELAHEVIKDDGLYCIIYVCCNLQIAEQNIGTLCDRAKKVDLSQSRLSMQHFVYHKQKFELQNGTEKKQNHGNTMIMSLTPATSFKMTGGMGSAPERALIYNCLILLDEFKAQKENLSKTLQGRVGDDSWKSHKDFYAEEVKKITADIVVSMSSRIAELREACDITNKTQGESINKLRKIFAQISLETMKPDLVIMDEFQKFSSLLDSNSEEEESLIAQKFFKSGDGAPYILLLSATPYKPYTTIEEINQENNDEQFQDFHRLMSFMYDNSTAKAEEFKKTWKEYSTLLSKLDITSLEQTVKKHNEAENMLYGVMGRTERSNKGIIEEIRPNLSTYLSREDIVSYMQMHNLVEKCKQHGVTTISAPVDYTKSCAYQLSFMENYKLKDKIEQAWKKVAGMKPKIDLLLLDKNAVEKHEEIKYGNAKLAYLIDTVFGKERKGTGVENLLWVPASQPYYTQDDNVFTQNANFSKTIIFSSWGMVPRMLSCLMTYECERRVGLRKESSNFSEPLRGDKKSRGKTILHTVSTWLADLYDPQKHYHKDIKSIRAEIAAAIKVRLAEIAPEAKRAARVSSLDIFQLLIALNDPQEGVRSIHENSAEILADIAIGSPAICLYRAFRQIVPDSTEVVKYAQETAEKMISIFNTSHGAAAVNKTCKSGTYFQKVLDYCILGNLQAVLDEYVHMIGCKDISAMAERIQDSFIGVSNLKINTRQTFKADGSIDITKAINMPKHFAIDLAGENSTEKTTKHAVDVRTAFNSPFRPFILASTSVGQEGLDFHWYSRKMIHWNLPSNPQTLEQREGRINRYKCHSIRRNIANLYAAEQWKEGPVGCQAENQSMRFMGWNEMFEKAKTELTVNESGMIPFWYLPLEHEKFEELEKNSKIERIERIVPMFPFSEDVERYDKLIKVLSLYRLTMGQPRQEELVNTLATISSLEMIEQLIFRLSPYFRR